jgi:hypothetical protein
MSDTEIDHLGLFLKFADTVQANAALLTRPVYAETCPCGGSVEVGRDAPAAERRRIWSTFIGRHQDCLARVTSSGECACEGYTIRTDYGTGVEHDVDRSSCPVHGRVIPSGSSAAETGEG